MTMKVTNRKLCLCGCGMPIVIKPYHSRYGIPNFIKVGMMTL